MAGKIFMNILLNIGIVLMVMSIIWGYNKQNYGVLVAAVIALAFLIFMKIRLVKSVRELTNRKR